MRQLMFYTMLVFSFTLFRAEAQSYAVTRSTWGAGGASAANPDYTINGTLGQTISGNTAGNTYRAYLGFWYRGNLLVGLPGTEDFLPLKVELKSNYPNPFNPSTTLRFALPGSDEIRIEIFNSLGQRVAVLPSGTRGFTAFSAGWHELKWHGTTGAGSPVASGAYYYRLSTKSGFTQTRRMLLIK